MARSRRVLEPWPCFLVVRTSCRRRYAVFPCKSVPTCQQSTVICFRNLSLKGNCLQASVESAVSTYVLSMRRRCAKLVNCDCRPILQHQRLRQPTDEVMLSRNLAALPALYFALVIQLADDTVAEPTKVLSSFKVDPFKILSTLHCHSMLHATP